jgi:polyhydroxybutyrate depolymerase
MGVTRTSFFGAGVLLIHFLLTPVTLQAGTFRDTTLTLRGQDRTFRMFVPTRLEESIPVVFVFHGTQEAGHGASSIINLTHFDRIAEANHFIAIFPEAFAGNWNDGRENEMAQSYRQDIDDVAFVDKILEKVKTEYPIDLHRIYAAGFSNGAIFCHYLAASRSTLFAAIAPVSGQLAFPFSKRFRPKNSVSVLEIHGTTDPVVPYNGGRITDDGGEVIGVEETVEYWARADGCKSRYLQLPMADLNPNDDCYPEKFLWADGRHDTDVVLCRVVGGGHTWPGSTLPFYFFFLGNVCLDFDASQMIWNFFRSHPKAKPTAAVKGAVESSAHPGRLTGSLQDR